MAVGTVENNLLLELRAIRSSLLSLSPRHSASEHAPLLRSLERIEACFSRPLRLAVMGEQNSGKSLLINYLLRHQILPSGGFAGENTEILIRYAPEASVHSIGADGLRTRITSKAFGRLVKPENRGSPSQGPSSVIYDASSASRPVHPQSAATNLVFSRPRKNPQSLRLIEVGLPLELLKTIELVEVRSYPQENSDNPAFRAFRHVNLAIWCTLATQAWKESEVMALRRIPEAYRRGALMLVTYKDAIRQSKDEAKITARLRHSGGALFDDVALVSLRDAVRALISSDLAEASRLRQESNIEAVERAIVQMIKQWQAHRLQKASRMLRTLAHTVIATSDKGSRISASREFGIRLERLATDFMHASPTISLSMAAA